MSIALTRRQQAIYDYLHDHQERFEHPPTLAELVQRRRVLETLLVVMQVVVDALLAPGQLNTHSAVLVCSRSVL